MHDGPVVRVLDSAEYRLGFLMVGGSSLYSTSVPDIRVPIMS